MSSVDTDAICLFCPPNTRLQPHSTTGFLGFDFLNEIRPSPVRITQRQHRRPPLTLRLQNVSFNSTKQIAAAQAGNEKARAWIVSTYTPIAYRYAMRMLRNEQDAHDAAHDSMVKVLRSLDRYSDEWKFSTWVISITRNTCIDEIRKRKKRTFAEAPDTADTAPGPFEITSRRQRSDLVQDALSRLSPLYRDVLVLYHFEHLKYQEIADVLDLPIGTVMNRIFRARQKLRTEIEAAA